MYRFLLWVVGTFSLLNAMDKPKRIGLVQNPRQTKSLEKSAQPSKNKKNFDSSPQSSSRETSSLGSLESPPRHITSLGYPQNKKVVSTPPREKTSISSMDQLCNQVSRLKTSNVGDNSSEERSKEKRS